MGLRVAAVLIGLIAALAPAALLAYDAGSSGPTQGIVAQATGTATATATRTSTATASPSAPKTGSAGLIDQSGSLAAAAVLVVLAVSVVAGGRVLSTRRNS
jgi:hypothetical protein